MQNINHLRKKRTRSEEKVNNTLSSVDNNSYIRCQLDDCNNINIRKEFYEEHFETYHEFLCEACHKNFINDFILNLHIEENHDPFNYKRKRVKCFDQGCKKMFTTKEERKIHFLTCHKDHMLYIFFKTRYDN
ncbi:uncharacterized protein SCDLUD_000712 [Saccharomycodes ludwigii]|uniref:uncharacterized protein n=1 Tax=Saccharomycodes ludwigii TaxID=36035 RepID=UPI001E85FB98|nr:hypothetical protein SCDLUD_000712 [Saccharomycodes ludwigii]KAH3903100.1 hypothetical protein SCDLUD_000712 [Saccharomycodes ludwigii]